MVHPASSNSGVPQATNSRLAPGRNAGSNTLYYSVTKFAAWLSLPTPASGSSTGQTNLMELNLNVAGLAPASYAAAVVVSSTNAANTPQVVPVMLTILADSEGPVPLLAVTEP